MLKILEEFTCAKNGIEKDNEDGYFVSQDFVAAVDGATSKGGQLHKGKTGGRVIRDIVLRNLKKMDSKLTADEAFDFLQEAIYRSFPAAKYWSAAASAVIYSVYRKEIWFFGDCQAMVNGKAITNGKKIDNITSEARSYAIRAFLKNGLSKEALMLKDDARDIIMPLLKFQPRFENRNEEFGYLVLNNHKYDAEQCHKMIKIIPVNKGSEIVLASDGYVKVKKTLEESEKYLFDIVKKDPLCYDIYKSTKGLRKGNISFDDRTYVRFKN